MHKPINRWVLSLEWNPPGHHTCWSAECCCWPSEAWSGRVCHRRRATGSTWVLGWGRRRRHWQQGLSPHRTWTEMPAELREAWCWAAEGDKAKEMLQLAFIHLIKFKFTAKPAKFHACNFSHCLGIWSSGDPVLTTAHLKTYFRSGVNVNLLGEGEKNSNILQSKSSSTQNSGKCWQVFFPPNKWWFFPPKESTCDFMKHERHTCQNAQACQGLQLPERQVTLNLHDRQSVSPRGDMVAHTYLLSHLCVNFMV